MIVLDASAAIELVLRTPAGASVARRLMGEAIHAPHLLDLEVCNVLRRLESKGTITLVDSRTALDDFQALAIERHGHDLLVPRIWQLRRNVTSYDAAYLSLAELLWAPVVTRDAKLAASTGHRATIDLIVP